MVWLGESEGETAGAIKEARHPFGDLLGRAEVAHHQHRRKVAHDARLVLQVVVQAEALRRKVLADDCHLDVARALTAELGRQRQSQPTCRVGAATHLAQQLFPVLPWHATVFEIGAGVFAAMIEEADVVVLLLERFDLALDEFVELVERYLNVGGNFEVHRCRLEPLADAGCITVA